MQRVLNEIQHAATIFRRDLKRLSEQGGITRDIYVRYLSFQYHLTKGVQQHFMIVAAHPAFSGRRQLRDFLYRFALEEEPHFDIARHDLEQLGVSPLPCPLDVRLWWAYFNSVIPHRPFIRLGATCILENLGAGAGALGHNLLQSAPFLNEKNTRFLQIHFHEELPHGDQIVNALTAARLEEDELLDVVEGARTGAVLYLRMARWAMRLDELTNELPISSDCLCRAL